MLHFNKLYALKQEVEAEHFWAKTALEWLLPEPVFHCSFKNGDSGVGIEPEVGKLKIQQPGVPCTDGYSHRFGPDIYMDEVGRDNFQIWRLFKEKHGEFSTDLHWSETPVMFQEDFSAAWKALFPRNLEDLQSLRKPGRTDFFEKFDVYKVFPFDGKSGSIDMQIQFKFIFESISRDHHVFLFPKIGRFKKTEIEAAFKQFAAEVKESQNIGRGSLLGGYLAWESLCRIKDRFTESEESKKELQRWGKSQSRKLEESKQSTWRGLFEEVYGELADGRAGCGDEMEDIVDTSGSVHGALALYKRLDDPLGGKGLIQCAYPLEKFVEML